MSLSAQKSTNGRSRNPGAPPALRAGMGVLQAVAPPLAERLAERLFFTPPRVAPPEWERAALAQGEPFALRAAGTTVRGRRLGRGPAVLLMHGWGGRGGQLTAFATPLLQAGCAVVAFDGPAHGASGGRTTHMVRHAEAATAVARHFSARAAIGHSFGGAALAIALHRGLSLHAAVLVGAPRAPRGFFEPFCDAMGLRDRTRHGLRGRIERRVGVSMDDLDLSRLAPALRTPALVVHDRADGEVPFVDGAAIAAAWPGARFLPTEGLGHRRVLREPAVVREVADFVVGRMQRCGCGRLASKIAHGAPRCEGCRLALHLEHIEERVPRPVPTSGLDATVDAILKALDEGPFPAGTR